jgi:hypothetical protein
MTDTKRKWIVVCDPVGRNPGTIAKAKSKVTGSNEGGMVVRLTNGIMTEEVGRVGFVRANTSNKRVGFKPMLDKMTALAWDVADALEENQKKIDELLATYNNGELQ